MPQPLVGPEHVRKDLPDDPETQPYADTLRCPPFVKVCPGVPAEMTIKKYRYESFNDMKAEIAKEKGECTKEAPTKHQPQGDCIPETAGHPDEVRDGNRHRHGGPLLAKHNVSRQRPTSGKLVLARGSYPQTFVVGLHGVGLGPSASE